MTPRELPPLSEILARGRVLSQAEIFRSYLKANSRPRRHGPTWRCYDCGGSAGNHVNGCPNQEPEDE